MVFWGYICNERAGNEFSSSWLLFSKPRSILTYFSSIRLEKKYQIYCVPSLFLLNVKIQLVEIIQSYMSVMDKEKSPFEPLLNQILLNRNNGIWQNRHWTGLENHGLDSTWINKTWIDKTWINKTWIDKIWVNKT